MKINIQPEADIIIKTLREHGFEAYAVGGCVRNAMMGLDAHDWDICTNARPDELRAVFRDFNTYDYGLKHGTLVVTAGGGSFEVTSYRVDGVYADNRRPESVTFTDDLSLDLSRRDFTVNAMAYNDEDGLKDPFGGAEDLKNGLLRCVGVPENRFNEDALRILRGLRFASVYGFAVEKETADAVHRNARLLRNIAAERVREELLRTICGKNAANVLDEFRDVIAVVIPELSETFDFPQNTPHHKYDVWRHILHSVEAVEPSPELRMTMLLHDIGKPRARTTDENGCDHFKYHQKISAEMAETILRRLRCPSEFIKTVLTLTEWHDLRFTGGEKQVRRVLRDLGEENTRMLFAVQRADIAAQSDHLRTEKLAALDLAERSYNEILAQNRCFSLAQLAVNGNDLLAVGVKKGKNVGALLHLLLEEVIDGDLPNEKNALLERAKSEIKKI